MALFDQQQQEEEQPNQIQPYGVCVGNRRVRIVQHVPYVPDVNMGRPLFRARQQPAYPVREQQHVMLQDRINQDVQHNMIQDNIAYNRRLYDDPQGGARLGERRSLPPSAPRARHPAFFTHFRCKRVRNSNSGQTHGSLEAKHWDSHKFSVFSSCSGCKRVSSESYLQRGRFGRASICQRIPLQHSAI